MAELGFFFIFLMLVVYLLPAIIAVRRGHRNTLGICLLTTLLGWTFLGWVGALIWSVNKDRP